MKRYILIADTDEQELKKRVNFFNKLMPDATIFSASKERDVLQKLLTQRFDLFVCDLSIARGYAIPFLEKTIGPFAENRPGWSLIISADPKPTILGNFKKQTFFPKPIDENFFLEIISTVCGISIGTKKSSIDVNFINPFIEAALNVLATTANIEAKKKSVSLRKATQVSGDISSLIPMNSERYLGSMAISFEEKCFLSIVSSMLGESYTEITDDIQDAAGELCNQIFGQAKMVLNQRGHTIQAAIPSVISGKGHKIKHLIDGTCIVVEFETAAGNFVVETIMRERRDEEL